MYAPACWGPEKLEGGALTEIIESEWKECNTCRVMEQARVDMISISYSESVLGMLEMS